ncbi:peptidoglycan DD-metalloendopeptidase family protein [Pseudoalteromonas sp. MMG024]|uniref:peptidoglycan DD-metalloendopeptidase family protein n=1 Tax=Pseudoalteromonas sp. MMG024 TaxID=2909980 RepID=UPI001F2A08B4|nr:peptidoglycan DD-metalloendopeptidase family protein [Pseudoalteromonas sp. MMG024]MCF6458389.1 peptidoglycan DD-metalloendopeptidase family protein [Pseudoalteromonas sp. MMG024]
MVLQVQKLPKKHKLLLAGVVTFISALVLLPSEKASASRHTNHDALEIGKRYELAIEVEKLEQEAVTAKAEEVLPEVTLNFKEFKVKKGDNLAKIFKRAGFSASTLHKIVNANKLNKQLTKIHPGDSLFFAANENNELIQLNYQISRTETLVVKLNDDQTISSSLDKKAIEKRTDYASGTIDSSFWNAGLSAGLNEKQIISFANIFGWDIDFANDLRKGDAFTLIYENHYVDGEFIGTGKILAAEFVNQGESYAAVRHSDDNFYTPEGRSLRKAFLRAPVNFRYISSNFNPRRKHPVTGRVKAHRGIDYAAKTGTPVVAAGNGTVIKAGYNKYNGNYVFIRHGQQYVTKYLHLHKRKVKRGEKVKQGELIGTVGATGRVTGAHLHYEFLVNGVHRNPRTVKLPKAQSLPKSELANFRPYAQEMLVSLQKNRELQLALAK